MTVTLHHLAISHYNEKVRWALDLKGVAHRRRAMAPGVHRVLARRIAGTSTLPALVDTDTGTRLGDSSEILEWLDTRWPEPRLYPEGPAGDRVRDIETYFDEEVGPAVRGFSYAYLVQYPRAMRVRWADGLEGTQKILLAMTFRSIVPRLEQAFSLTPENLGRRAETIRSAFDRIDGWLQDNRGYLEGEAFTAADLTAIALLGPMLKLPDSPWAADGIEAEATRADPGFPPPALEEFRHEMREREAGRWALRIWDRYRRGV